MKRRELVTGTIVGMASLSGCAGMLEEGNDVSDSDGDGAIDSEDYAPNDPDVQEKSDLQNSNTDGSEGDNHGGQSSDTPTQTEHKEQKQEILDAYNTGVSKANAGTTRLGTAVSAYNNENFSKSLSKAEAAETRYTKAEEKFARAVNLSLRIGHQQAVDISDEAQRYALKMQMASTYSQMAAEEATNGNMEQANSFAQKHREKVSEAEELTVQDPPELKSVLNL